MREEALNTDRHRSQGGTQLRSIPIAFVPAGALDPADLLKPINAEPREEKEEEESDDDEEEDTEMPNAGETASPQAEPESNGEETTMQIDVGKIDLGMNDAEEATVAKEVEITVAKEIEVTKEVTVAKEEDQPAFMVDLTGDDEISAKIAPPTVRVPSPALSDSSSSSEKIVFVPKGKRSVGTSEAGRFSAKPPPPQPVVVKTITSSAVVTSVSSVPGVEAESSKASEEEFIDIKNISLQDPSWKGQRVTKGNKRRKPKGGRRRPSYKDDAAVRDYVENLKAQMALESEDGEPATLPIRELGGGPGDDRDVWEDDSSTDEDEAASDEEAVRRYKNDWDSDYLRDFDDVSTDDEGTRGLVSAILRKRVRPSGEQYLIKWDGYETDDATWTLKDKLDSSADSHVKQFEADLLERDAQLSDSSGSESSDEEDSDEEDEEEEADTDEDAKLAKFLQRQEDLRMMGVEGGDDYDEIMDLDDDFFPMGVGKKSKQQKKRANKRALPDITPDRSGRYPSASKLASEYDGFDVMDWERASLQKQKKTRKGKARIAALNLSDSELEATLNNTWMRDREKKKLRKIQRQEQRLQGLLGVKAKKTGKPDLGEKYKNGMTMTQVFEEIKQFMMRDHNKLAPLPISQNTLMVTDYLRSLALPPMSKYDRKCVHDLAGKLNLKSKSVGKGTHRFTTIFKTNRSVLFEGDEEGVDSILRRGRFAKHMDVASREKLLNKSGKGGGRGGGAKHREGMVVGAEAPELSADNRGRIMLEKMGYRAGMTLGVEGSGRGIAEPVMAIIKMSRTGLG
jgi:hypothetical protein